MAALDANHDHKLNAADAPFGELRIWADANGNGKTDISQDGGGFSNNPSISILNLGRPSVHKVAFQAGPGVTRITVNLKYM